MMPKGDTIAEITRLNPTADPDFLTGFSNGELSEYLDRLANLPEASLGAHCDSVRVDGAGTESTAYSISAPGVSSP